MSQKKMTGYDAHEQQMIEEFGVIVLSSEIHNAAAGNPRARLATMTLQSLA
jgi:hypothetical protein